jgi:queuine tRNA-ribosyltransferase catalytic subunit
MCAEDVAPIDSSCPCEVCRSYSRAAIHAALCNNTAAGATLVSIHNVAYTQDLTCALRQAILAGTFADFVRRFMATQYGSDVPQWIRNALGHAGIELDS